MASFFNQASLSYGDTITNSNITTADLLGGLTASKIAFNTSYTQSDTLVYGISITNTGASAVNSVTVSDNLGAFADGAVTVVPLDYVDGSLVLFINGVEVEPPTVTNANPLTVSGIAIPAGGNALLVYRARVNGSAPLSDGSVITNVALVSGSGEPVSVSAEVPVRDEVRLTIAKAVSPAEVSEGGLISYTFIIQNTGNTAVVAADDVVITDTFDPILGDIAVTLDGEEFADYTYNTENGLFTTNAGAITVPAASFTTAPDGAVITTPGVTVLVVTGTVG